MAVPMASSAKGVTFGGFERRVPSFRVAGVALCDIPTCFRRRRKSFCVTGAIHFASFSDDELHSPSSNRHFAWQGQGFRHVVLRVFLRIAMSGLREVVTTCKFCGRPGIL